MNPTEAKPLSPSDASAALALCAEAERHVRGGHYDPRTTELLDGLASALRTALAQAERDRKIVEAAGRQAAAESAIGPPDVPEPLASSRLACDAWQDATEATEAAYRAAYPAETKTEVKP